jgi:predicted N-acetyltransferase YhbS
MSPAIETRALTPADLAAVQQLHARVFGPGRFARSAYRVREGKPLLSPFCRAAFRGRQLVAALRLSPVAVGGRAGALLLGPLAVAPEFAGQGHGRRLIGEALAAAREAGVELVVLVGDEPYYGRFGFVRVPPGQIVFPGPVNPARILAAPLREGALEDYRGLVGAAP